MNLNNYENTHSDENARIRGTLNNASDYRTNGLYRTPNPNPNTLTLVR